MLASEITSGMVAPVPVVVDVHRVLGVEGENVLCLPDLGIRDAHGNFLERYLVVGGDVELQVIARLVFGRRRSGLGLKNQFLDEGRHVFVADHAEAVGGGSCERPRPPAESRLRKIFPSCSPAL